MEFRGTRIRSSELGELQRPYDAFVVFRQAQGQVTDRPYKPIGTVHKS